MKAAGALVLTADPGEAASRAVREARESLGGLSVSFGVLFASAHFFGSAQALLAAVAEETGPIPLIGCVSAGVAGGAREVWAVTVVRPRCRGTATARTVPPLTGRNIWLVEVIVAVHKPHNAIQIHEHHYL